MAEEKAVTADTAAKVAADTVDKKADMAVDEAEVAVDIAEAEGKEMNFFFFVDFTAVAACCVFEKARYNWNNGTNCR